MLLVLKWGHFLGVWGADIFYVLLEESDLKKQKSLQLREKPSLLDPNCICREEIFVLEVYL